MQEKLTQREQEILNMMLNGTALKEIAYTLKIKYPTAAYHQKNMFRKLGVQNNIELLVKYLRESPVSNNIDHNKENPAIGIPADFYRWDTFKDEIGTIINVIVTDDIINGKTFTCTNVFGKMADDKAAYCGIAAYNTETSRSNMIKMSSFSFMALGDGKTYEVMLTTVDTRTKGSDNHYRKQFSTVKGKPTFFRFNVNELARSSRWGAPVPFIQNNIEYFQFQIHCNGYFNLKVWDFRFYL